MGFNYWGHLDKGWLETVVCLCVCGSVHLPLGTQNEQMNNCTTAASKALQSKPECWMKCKKAKCFVSATQRCAAQTTTQSQSLKLVSVQHKANNNSLICAAYIWITLKMKLQQLPLPYKFCCWLWTSANHLHHNYMYKCIELLKINK